MTPVLRHAVLAHRHIAGQQFANLGFDTGLIHPKGIRNTVPHRPHRVMRHVTVQRPISWDRDEFEIAHLPDADDFGDFRSPGRTRPAATVAAGDPELHAVQVDRVVPHG